MTTVVEQDLNNVDLSEPSLWEADPPYELFARMQREAPVHFSAQRVAPGEGGFWSITRADDVRAVTRDFKTFSSEQRGVFLVDDIGAPLDVHRMQMISMDPPRHDRLKALVINAFTPARVAEHESHINEMVSDVLRRVAEDERFDLVADVARPIPARVIGSDSTRATYSATMLALLRNPDQLALLRERPELIDATVEEGLRYAPAFAFMARTATRDIELHGQTIKENDRVLLWYLASNRDESVFEDPHRFDITRKGLEDHQAFGGRGRHFCLGANLARLELRLWIQQTLERFPDLALDGEPTRVRALFLNQYDSIPVRRSS